MNPPSPPKAAAAAAVAVADDHPHDHPHDASSSSNSPPVVQLPRIDDPATIKKDLTAFQSMLGIISLPVDKGGPRRYFKNEGIYSEIRAAELWRKRQYYACNWLLDGAMLIQIILAATLTALGAAESSHMIITIFGAINTAVAGLLALMKGQGLPERLRRDWYGLRDVRDLIDERERSIGQGWVYTGVKEEVDAILKRYKEVQDMIENNRPETYYSQAAQAAKWAMGSGGNKNDGERQPLLGEP